MKKIKEEKGITLVALIITIVVLLILAAVAIGTVKNSDIIGHAQNAAGGYNQAKANELEALAGYEETLNKYVPNEEETIRKLLQKYAFEGDDTKLIEKGIVLFCQDPNYPYMIADTGKNLYAYYLDLNNSTVITIREEIPYYTETEQLKGDIVALKKAFVGKNIESFNPEKSGENWVLDEIDGLGDINEITIKYNEYHQYLYFNFKDYSMAFQLNFDNLNVTDSAITGKIIKLSQSFN